jgi:ubiquinone/menaquinone biosynthesis C-methylase UbiE
MGTDREAQTYADFLLPHLSTEMHLVDIGCGDGELSLSLASEVRQVTGIDVEEEEIETARERARQAGIGNASFRRGDAYALDLPDGCADAVLAHSVLEALGRPEAALAEIRRIARPGAVVGAASVEYGGLILAGPAEDLLRRFYSIREQLWLLDGADPYRGRRLRGLFVNAGFTDVVATTKYIAYGTAERVRDFGQGRAEDCVDEWYVDSALRHGLATSADLSAMREAWLAWAEASTSYAAFAWCRALGRMPRTA